MFYRLVYNIRPDFNELILAWSAYFDGTLLVNFYTARIAAFHTQIFGNYSICLSVLKLFSYHICYENVRQTTEAKSIDDWGYFQLELNNMLVEKNVMNN